MSAKPLLFDVCCCEGGAARGYAEAGFEVVGVDIEPQPNYPFAFIEADALEFLTRPVVRTAALVHVSPPCQGYSPHVSSASSQWTPTKGKDEPRLIPMVREALRAADVEYVIENVMGARDELRANLQLCGTMFGLPISRHRLFECSWLIAQPEHPNCRGVAKRFAAAKGWDYRDMTCTGKGRRAGTADRWKEILGLTGHMSQAGIAECIPPAYTKFIGEQFLANRARGELALTA